MSAGSLCPFFLYAGNNTDVWLELKHLFWTMGEHAKDNGTGKGSQVLDGLEFHDGEKLPIFGLCK